MAEKLQSDKETDETPAFAPDLPVGARAKSEEYTRALLRAYQETFDVAEDLPAIVWIQLREKGLGRFIKVPYLRWFLRYFLSDHIHRGLTALNRRCHATAALTNDSEANQANRTAVEHYLQALPPPPYKRLGLAVLFLVLALTLPLRNLGDVSPILQLVTHATLLNFSGVTEVMFTIDVPEALQGTLLLLLALLVVGFPPTSTFVLKRLLFNLYPGAKERLGSIAVMDHAFIVEGLYALEDRTFGEFGSRRPKEFPFDLLLRILALVLLVPLLILFMTSLAFLPALLFSQFERYLLWSAIVWVLLTVILFVVFIIRLKRLLLAWRKRNRPSEVPPDDRRDSQLHHAAKDAERDQGAGRRTYALARERLEQVTQRMIELLPPLRTKKSPRLAFMLGFLFNGFGLGIYFRSWVDLIVPTIASIAWLMSIAALHHSGLWIGVLVIGGLWGLLRTISSNERL